VATDVSAELSPPMIRICPLAAAAAAGNWTGAGSAPTVRTRSGPGVAGAPRETGACRGRAAPPPEAPPPQAVSATAIGRPAPSAAYRRFMPSISSGSHEKFLNGVLHSGSFQIAWEPFNRGAIREGV